MKLDQMKENLSKKFKKTQAENIKIKVPRLEDYKGQNGTELRPYDNNFCLNEISTCTVVEQEIPITKKEITHTGKTQQEYNEDTTESQSVVSKNKSNEIEDTKKTQIEAQIETHNAKPMILPSTKNCLALTGNSLKIIKEIFLFCGAMQSLETGYIPKVEFSRRTGVTIGSIKTTVYRLLQQKIIDEIHTTKGQGSLWSFKLSKERYDQISMLFSNSNTINRDTIRDTRHSSSSRSLNINKSTTTDLPSEWHNINLSEIKEILAFGGLYPGQFFGLSQLKSIYHAVGHKTSAKEIQDTIDKFAYGLKNYKDHEPYKNMDKPAAILFSMLKEGDLWNDPFCLTAKEQELKKIYDNAIKIINRDAEEKFNNWFNENQNNIVDDYKKTISSSAYVNQHEVKEFAIKYFKKSIWIEYKTKEITALLGEENRCFIEKMINIEQQRTHK